MNISIADLVQRSLLILAGILIFLGIVPPASAQIFESEWGTPDLVFSPPQGEKTNELWVTRDDADRIYLWWNLFPVENEEARDAARSAVIHAQFTNGRWQGPNDILIWPDGGRLTSTVIDNVGTLHAFSATDCISYSHARWHEALSAQNWSERQCIDGTGLTNPSAAVGPDGTIFVAYADPGTKALRLIKSTNNGKTWSIVSTIDETIDGFLNDPALTVDDKGILHVAWSVGSPPSSYPPLGVYYSRSENGGENWKLPIQLSGMDEGEPAIAVHEDEVHVLWNGDVKKGGRYYRYSKDAGDHWELTETLSPQASAGGQGGLQRPPAIITDGTGTVHVLLHEQEALYYLAKVGTEWTDKELLFTPSDFNSREIREPRLVITNGNQLHAFYIIITYARSQGDDAVNNISRIYHQFRMIDAPQEDPTPLSIPASPESATTSTPTEAMITSTFQPTNDELSSKSGNSIEASNPGYILILSASIVMIFISLVLIFSWFRH
ncbi:MAG: exo-alpha-sialidase [Chloroflexi bacterium]|nr:exo-alpha-sialidase [Chloroflexota bacterium]